MRDARVDEEVAGLLDPAARSARRSTATTYGVVKGITACLVLVSAAALVLVRHLRFSRSVTLSDGRALRARDARDARDARALSQQDGIPNAAPPSRHALRDARHARANPGALTPPVPLFLSAQVRGGVPGRSASLRESSHDSYKSARCSATWFDHVQFTGGTSFQRSLNDLVKTNGVDAKVLYSDDTGSETPTLPGQPGMLGYVEDFPSNLNVYGFGEDAETIASKVSSVTNHVLESIDRGNRGAYVIAHHINTPGILMLEKHLDAFRDALNERGCGFAVVATARDPIMHRVSEHLKFFPMTLEKDMRTLLRAVPSFPEHDGATPFRQMREFLFMDEFVSAAAQMATPAGRDNAGDDAPAAIEANTFLEAVTRAASARGVAVDAFLEEGAFESGDLTEEERSAVGASPAEAARGFKDACDAIVRVADRLIEKFDITLVRTEDQGEGLERLATKMDWHPELMRAEGTDAFETARRNARDKMNAHTFVSDEVEVDVDAVPFALRKSLHAWTELDLALYVLSAAQAERFAAEREAKKGDENEADCPPPNLRDAYALAVASRPDAAQPDRNKGGTRAVLDAVLSLIHI